MNHIIVFTVLLILIAISVIYYYSYNNNIKNHIKDNFQDIPASSSQNPASATRNVTLDEINQLQNSIDSIVNQNSETDGDITSNLEQINTKMNNILLQQISDHDKIKNSMKLTIDELVNTINVIERERNKLNLRPEEPYLIKNIPQLTTPPPTETFTNLMQHKVHPRITDFINFEPDWRVEWNKNIHNANVNPLLILP